MSPLLDFDACSSSFLERGFRVHLRPDDSGRVAKSRITVSILVDLDDLVHHFLGFHEPTSENEDLRIDLLEHHIEEDIEMSGILVDDADGFLVFIEE